MKKNKFLIVGLSFGIIMTMFLLVQNLFFDNDNPTFSLSRSILASIIGGTVAGLVFALILRAFSKFKMAKNITITDLQPQETILFNTNANHFKGFEGVGGKLFLTNKRLVFKSHKFNIQNHDLSININVIKIVERYKTANIINNGLKIETATTAEKFVVEEAEEWLKKLQHV